MITKIINGVECVQRDVVYTDFGAVTKTEKMIVIDKSEGKYKTPEGRKSILTDVQYSWDKDSLDYEFESDRTFSEEQDSDTSYIDSSTYQEEEDREYSTGMLPSRLISLRRPIHMQLRDLYREHARVYRSKQKTMKSSDVELIMNDFRYELHRIIALAKDELAKNGGNMDTILKVSSIGGGIEVKRALMKLTILFKRIEKAFETYGFLPRNLQIKLNDELSILISHFVLDIYGPEIEKRKREAQEDPKKGK